MGPDRGGFGAIAREDPGMLTAAMPAPANGRAWTPPDAARWVRTRSAASRSSFFWAMRLLPRDRRQAMLAVYAFCRAVDDIADGAAPVPDKMAVKWWPRVGSII